MRIIAIIITVLIAVASCQEQPDKAGTTPEQPQAIDTSEFTTIQWIDSSQKYGTIQEGEKLEVSFRYKNSGNKPLVIYMVKPSCGCTLAETPGKPLAPGETGEIKASFDSEGKPGLVQKSIDVIANTKGSQNHRLIFEVDVKPKK